MARAAVGDAERLFADRGLVESGVGGEKGIANPGTVMFALG